MEKKYPGAESRIYAFVCGGEREKKSSFQISLIIFKAYKKVILQFIKGFKNEERLTKTSFFLYIKDRPKNGKGNK